MSGVPGLLSVVVRSMVGLLGGCVGDRCVDAVGGCAWAVLRVGRCGGPCGDIRVQFLVMGGSGLLCALRWLDGTVLAVLCGGTFWAVQRQAQSSLMVRHWKAGGVGRLIVQCW